MGPPVGSYLENSEPKILEDFDEEGMQGEPYSELEVALRQSNITIRRSMRSLCVVKLDHLEAILPRYPCTILWHNQRLEVATADRYFLRFFLALATRSRHRLLHRLHSSPSQRMRGDLRYRLSGRSVGRKELPRQGVTLHGCESSPRGRPNATAPLARHLQIESKILIHVS